MDKVIIVAQVLGIIGMVLDVSATLQKSDKKLMRVHSAASVFLSIHYMLLGALPGALSEALIAVRTIIASYNKHRAFGIFFIILCFVLIFTSRDSALDMLAPIATLFSTIGLYFFEAIRLRIFYMISFAIWLVYSIYVFTIGGIMLFVMMLITSSYTIWRLKKARILPH